MAPASQAYTIPTASYHGAQLWVVVQPCYASLDWRVLLRSVIADCERALDMRSSDHAAAAAAAVAVTVAAILISHHHRQSSGRQRKETMSSGESLENECVSAMDSGSRGSNSTRFPWEPATASGSDGDDVVGEGEHMPGSANGEPSRVETKSTPLHHRPQRDQLDDFLASMNFASGLRQPNCPCCM